MDCIFLQLRSPDLGVSFLFFFRPEKHLDSIFPHYRNYDRLVNDYLGYSLNWTVPQMILCCKLTSLAWNYADGGNPNARSPNPNDKDDWMGRNKLTELPSLISVLSYALFFAGFLTGPWCDYKEYTDFVDRSLFKQTNYQIPGELI